MRLTENTLFDKRYQLVRLLGRGGFSEVWLAKDSYTKLDIAIKVYAPGQGMDSDGLADFSAELAGVYNLNHTNLLKPAHVDAWEGMPYLIMPFCSQGSVFKRIGKMSEEEIWKLIHDVAAGLAYLHENDIIHQDIKPDNILIDDNGNYVITDFGISTKARSTLRKSVIGGAVSSGTIEYMGPERFSDHPAPIKASDIWSLGATVYELITGNVPFGEMGGGMQKVGAEIPEITEPISKQLRYVIESMLAPETWDRPKAETLVEWASKKQSIDTKEYHSTKREIPAFPENNIPRTDNKSNNSAKEKKRVAMIVGGIVLLPVLWMLFILFSHGLYFSNTQVVVNCEANGLDDYFGEVNVYGPLFGTKLSDWWWDIKEVASTHAARKVNGGYRLDVSPNNSEEDRTLTFELRPKIGKNKTVTINQDRMDVKLTVSSTNLSFDAKGGKRTITVNANTAWEVEHPVADMYEVTTNGNKLTITVSPNTSSEDKSDYFNVKNKTGSKTVRINLKQTGKPSVEIEKLWVDHNVYEDSKKGMKIHLKMHTYNLKSKSCRAVAYFYTEEGTALTDENGSYCTTDGKVSCGESFKPGYDHALYEDFVLFMPHAEMHIKQNGGYKYYIKFWNNSASPSEDVGESEWQHFTFSL